LYRQTARNTFVLLAAHLKPDRSSSSSVPRLIAPLTASNGGAHAESTHEHTQTFFNVHTARSAPPHKRMLR